MGQKVNPVGIRLGISKEYSSKWFKKGREYADVLYDDITIRRFLEKKLEAAGISRIDIERPARDAKITIHTARPGVIIGKSGQEVERLRQEVSKRISVPAHIKISEVRKPDIDAYLVAENIAQQLAKRAPFRRAMKRAVQNALRAGVEGIKICVSGRLGGAEIARSEWVREGSVPLHTFRANIDYGLAESLTTYGIIGVKVWICRGERQNDQSEGGSAKLKPVRKKTVKVDEK